MEMSGKVERTPLPADKGERSQWFTEHFDQAASEILSFLGGDGIFLDGLRVADIGCGDGIIDLGLALKGRPSVLDGYDQVATDVTGLLEVAVEHGACDRLPASLQFHCVSGEELPVEDGSYDVVTTWSVFEHARDPAGLAGEMYRILRPGGIAFIQVWPFWFSEHGSHLWTFFPAGFAHLLTDPSEIESEVRATARSDPAWKDYLLAAWTSCNGMTVDDLQRALLAAGFFIGKCELMSYGFHIPDRLQHIPISSLGISGAKLLAARKE